ncbi:hypothetical protein HDV03_003085 [Kappamyces sp. JEL0829]|nr:hypothetical protein HDV03_003085 [Kappamyces sp. JEL0829]
METHGRRIRLFKNGDIYFPGKKMLISPTYLRNFEQFLAECSRELELGTRKVYTMEGVRLRDLSDLEDGRSYVCSGGDLFKDVSYNKDIAGPGFKAYSKDNLAIPAIRDNPILERKRINRSVGGLLSDNTPLKGSEAALFDASTKAFKIAVFENGEQKQEGMKIILNHRNCKTFDQLMRYFSSLKLTKSGQVRKMYEATSGKRIRHLSEIENGMNLVLSAFDPYKKVAYKLVDFTQQPSPAKKEPDVLRIVKFFPNGDAYHTGLTITLTRKRHPTLTRLLEQLNSQIELVTGKIQKVYSTDGSRLSTIDDFKSGGDYVLVANDDPFIKTQYNRLAIKPTTGSNGLNGYTLRNEYINRIRPITKRRLKRGGADDDESSTEAPARLRTTTKAKRDQLKGRFEDDGMETEREDEAPRKSVSRAKTPAPERDDSHESSAKATKPKTPAEPKDGAGKPKTPVAVPVPEPRSKTPAPEVRSKTPAPEARAKTPVQTVDAERERSKSAKAREDAEKGVPEDDSIINSTGREEEELFESEKHAPKVLSSNGKSKSKAEVKSRSQTPSKETRSSLAKQPSTKSMTKIPKLSSRNSSQSKIDAEREPSLPSKANSQVSL